MQSGTACGTCHTAIESYGTRCIRHGAARSHQIINSRTLLNLATKNYINQMLRTLRRGALGAAAPELDTPQTLKPDAAHG